MGPMVNKKVKSQASTWGLPNETCLKAFVYMFIFPVDQEIPNYSLWVQSGLPLVFVYKVLFAHSHTHLFMSHLCLLLSSMAEFSSCARGQMTLKTDEVCQFLH